MATRPIKEVASLDALQRFNVVVINFLPDVDAQRQIQPDQAAFERALGTYLERGGGVVVFAGGGAWGRMTPSLNHLLEPYGARVPDEQVVDPAHLVKRIGVGPRKVLVAMTQAIERAPAEVTAGISRLGYISQTIRADSIKMTQPILLPRDSKWQVVVRAEPSAYAAVATGAGGRRELERPPGSERGTPVLAASRGFGEGRLFLFPTNVAPTITSPEVFDSYLWSAQERSGPDVPQNRSFIMQAVRWAAQPSLASGVFGGYRTDARFRPDRQFVLPAGRVVDWARAPTGPRIAPPFGNLRGLIGAQSTFSGGAHSVAELSAAARSAGLSFLAFTERLDRLDARKWDELKAACRRQSGDQFLAIPGIAARNVAGDRYFALGWGAFPKPPAITADGTRIDQTYRFWATAFGGRFVGFTNVGENPNPWYEMKQISAIAVASGGRGRTDDATGAYLRSSYDMENYIPVTFTTVASAGEIASAAQGVVNVFAGRSLEDLRDYVAGSGAYTGKNMFWEDPHPWYLSSGPRLKYHGGIRLGSLGVDEERENVYRYGFRIEGLEAGDRVLLMDGPATYREWRPRGSTFEMERTWPHDQVRAFVIRVMRQTRTVLMSAPATLQWSRRFNQAGDRQNTVPYNYEPDGQGDWFVAGAPIGPKYKAWPPSTLIYGTFKSRETGAVGVEYTPILGMAWQDLAGIPLDPSAPAKWASLASYQHQRLSCPGIIVVDETTSRLYPDGGGHGPDSAPPKRTEPLEAFQLVQRRYGIYGALGQLNGQLVESQIRASKPVSLKGQRPLVAVSGFNLRTDSSMSVEMAIHGDAKRYRLTGHETVHAEEPVKLGDYLGVYPYSLTHGGAQYAIAGPLLARLRIGEGASLVAQYLLQVPAAWRAGQHFDYSILYTTGASLPERPQSDYAKAARFLGLDGSFPVIEKVSGGTLLPLPVIATIQTRPEDVVRVDTRFDADAPLGLPIRLRGFNPNWQVAYTLDGSPHWRYMGELDGDFYFHLYTQQRAHSVVAGQPLLADQSKLRITLDDPLGKQGAFELYNPTDQPMQVHLHTNPAFFPVRQFDVAVPPYTSKNLRVDAGD